jgi:hypothetical protein
MEAFGKNGCAVCRIIEEASASYLDVLFYEHVTDVGVRRKLRQARGLCNWHSWRVKDMPSAALGLAIIAQDLLEEESARLAALERRPRWRRLYRPRRTLLPRQPLLAYVRGWLCRNLCPACQAVSEHERHTLETMLNCIREEDVARQFAASSGLCLPHVVRLAEDHPRHPGLATLIGLQRDRQARLVADLEEFCRKHDYRFSREAWNAGSNAWLRAIEVLVGRPEIFGNDLRQRRDSQWRRFIRSLLERWR